MALAMCLVAATAVGQPQKPGSHSMKRCTVNFESYNGESYMVFIDGDAVNSTPQSRVMVNDLSDRRHEVVVVLRRPAQKAAVLQLQPGEPNIRVTVTYDARTETLSLYTPSHNRAEDVYTRHGEPHHHVPPVVPPADPNFHPATEADMQGMIERMKGQSFDSDKLALGKVIVASSSLTAEQIGRLAETISFSSTQVEFLEYAYPYCVDKMNYYKAVDVLAFSSDKQKVLEYIATLR